MTDTPNRLSLWQAMDNGMDAQANKEAGQTDPLVWRRIRAAEIRALRDWLVPETTHPGESEFWPDADVEREWQYTQHIRALLTTEADRAEHENTNN